MRSGGLASKDAKRGITETHGPERGRGCCTPALAGPGCFLNESCEMLLSKILQQQGGRKGKRINFLLSF